MSLYLGDINNIPVPNRILQRTSSYVDVQIWALTHPVYHYDCVNWTTIGLQPELCQLLEHWQARVSSQVRKADHDKAS